jgi:hypothetical protein
VSKPAYDLNAPGTVRESDLPISNQMVAAQRI